MPRPRVAMVVSEMEPLAKTGGLADVAGALSAALGKLGAEVHLFLPRYSCVKESRQEFSFKENVTLHLVDHPGYFHRAGLYGDGNGDYPDNLERFSFFCRQVLEELKRKGIQPEILHGHDWQAALSIVYCATLMKTDPFFAKVKTVFTVHNLAYQGTFPKIQYPKLGLPWELFHMNALEFYDQVNLLKGGLIFAGKLTTVSAAYAKEIQSPEMGERLEGVLRMRSQDLSGILNGIDVEAWNPATDPLIAHRFSGKDLSGKGKNKRALQKQLGLPVDPRAFLIGMVTRVASQKGLDLVVDLLRRFPLQGVQWVILGTGDRDIEQDLAAAAGGARSIQVRLAFDNRLAHQIYAGSDAFLMPSRYEPCGLGQMIAMRYGSIPIVRATGGLRDTVWDADQDDEMGNGFSFSAYDAGALAEVLERASRCYRDPGRWKRIILRGMGADFSWDRSARQYLELYEALLAQTQMA